VERLHPISPSFGGTPHCVHCWQHVSLRRGSGSLPPVPPLRSCRYFPIHPRLPHCHDDGSRMQPWRRPSHQRFHGERGAYFRSTARASHGEREEETEEWVGGAPSSPKAAPHC